MEKIRRGEAGPPACGTRRSNGDTHTPALESLMSLKSNMLNLFRNTVGAKEKFGERTEKAMLDNVITLLNEAENAGIFVA